MKPGFRIAIVGGGPGGLTLARLLTLGGIDAIVYERDADPLERPQGGTLDLHEESGLLALAQAGLTDAFLAVARYEDQGSRLLDRAGRVLFDDDGAGGNRPEVDRTALRALLLDALPPDCVQWGRTVREVRMQPDGRAMLVFEHGTEGPFDLVVGADGAWSRVRPLLSLYQPQYSGLMFIEFGIDDIDRQHPALSRLVGRGKIRVHGNGKAIIAQRNGHAHVRGHAIFRVPLDWVARRFDFAAPDAMRAALVAEFDGFADAFHDLFRASGDRFAERPIFALPVGHCWAHRRGVTLIGDAAHVMSPFGGEGVNNAMRDAAELAAGLIADVDRDAAVAAFEQHMFARVTESAREAADAAATQLSHDAEALTLARYRDLHAA
ncbi:FAD-dependent oxidoreductase [Burkholderia catarinensis]|uniref:FAD-dependent oxidoreductase n=1 Tax=Burkholderia catarinensis TaxID=1108140 RepID=UPI0009207A69|nr:NAD(P)/FAD-dependent oxidoreductase [Burkholderia catarinensis]KAG8154797.1 salicylate hydroxylase [Burkholderia catarinensis]